MHRTLESILTYLSLLASIGSFIVTALPFMPNLDCARCPAVWKTEQNPMPHPTLHDDQKSSTPRADGDAAPQERSEPANRALTQEAYLSVSRESLIQICVLVIAICMMGIIIMRLIRL